MGVYLSKHSALAPLSLVSIIIGFVSFAFTVATALRVFWENLNTLWSASDEVHDYLTNLRIELYEERSSLRKLRRHNKEIGHSGHRGKGHTLPRLDDVTIKSMQDIIRRLCRRFGELERPFLVHSGRYRSSYSPYGYGRESGGRVGEDWEEPAGKQSRRRRRISQDQNDSDDGQDLPGDRYCDMTLVKRFAWLRRRDKAIGLMQSLSRVQTRRIALQVGEITVALYNYGGTIEDIQQDLIDISGRMSRIIGVRRLE